MLNERIREMMVMEVAPGVKAAAFESTINKLGIRKDVDSGWEFERPDDSDDFSLKIRWKSLHYAYQDRNRNVWLMGQEAENFCVRDAFLFSVNLPAIGEQIAGVIEKVNNLGIS